MTVVVDLCQVQIAVVYGVSCRRFEFGEHPEEMYADSFLDNG